MWTESAGEACMERHAAAIPVGKERLLAQNMWWIHSCCVLRGVLNNI